MFRNFFSRRTQGGDTRLRIKNGNVNQLINLKIIHGNKFRPVIMSMHLKKLCTIDSVPLILVTTIFFLYTRQYFYFKNVPFIFISD